MTELAIMNVAYDPIGDEVVGVLDEYVMKKGEILKKAVALSLLERAHRIVTHNSACDQSLLDPYLPGIQNHKWICSLHGVEWKRLMGVQSARQSSLAEQAGITYKQAHHALDDARDLKELLAKRDESGRTYLGRLLDGGSKKIT